MLKYISKFSDFNEKAEALLKETITVLLESAIRVCTFEAYEDVKMELTKYLNVSFKELYDTLKKWFLVEFGKSFGVDPHLQWIDYTAEREIKVHYVNCIHSYITIQSVCSNGPKYYAQLSYIAHGQKVKVQNKLVW